MKNTIPVQSAGRQPRGIVQINGVSVPWITFEVDNNTFFAADTFRVTLPLSALPKGAQIADLFSTADIMVEVFTGFPADPDNYTAAQLDSLILGKADDVTAEFSETEVEISGRDLTGSMIDVKTSEKFTNLTSSAIVEKIAAKHGLTPKVTATTTKVGRYYAIDHVRLQDDRTEWDLITWLAREEGFVAYVQGKELHFEPPPQASNDPYVMQYRPGVDGPDESNATTFKISHAKTLAKDIVVTVNSWNRKQAKGFKKTAKASHTKSGINSSSPIKAGAAQEYSYVIPNLDADQAQQRANQILAELSKHEMKLEVEGPADNILQRTDVIQVQGTGSATDIVFYPSSITRVMEFGGGYHWTVNAKNHSPESQPDL